MTISFLQDNPLLQQRIAEIAEVAGYLWEKGWAERNGGNITVNITDCAQAFWADAAALLPAIALPIALPHLQGQYFFCKGTNHRMRDLSHCPMQNGSIIRIADDCAHYEIIADAPVRPTSELPSHLILHNRFLQTGSTYKAVLHTHPVTLVAMSHNSRFLAKDALTHLLWSMIPETRAFCPKGLGIIPYAVPGSIELAQQTLAQVDQYDVMLWEKHGVCAVGETLMEAFDQVDVLDKAALIYIDAKSMGFEPAGMTTAQMDQMARIFGLPMH